MHIASRMGITGGNNNPLRKKEVKNLRLSFAMREKEKKKDTTHREVRAMRRLSLLASMRL